MKYSFLVVTVKAVLQEIFTCLWNLEQYNKKSPFHLNQHINTTEKPPCMPEITILIYTHTHPFNGPFSGTTQVSQYQKGKTNLDFTVARDSEWQWHQLGHMQVCTLL